MGEPTFIKTPKGDEVVVLLREDYEQLLLRAQPFDAAIVDEDAADLLIANERQIEWERAGRPSVPLAIVKFVRAGDTYMRAFRKYRGLTQEDLAKRTGIAQGFLSDIEGARKNASVTTLIKIAEALDMHPTFLLPASPEEAVI